MSNQGIDARFAATAGDIAGAGMRGMFEMNLGSRLTFAERLDADALSRATRLLLDIEPVLGCWYHDTLLSAEWVRCADIDASIPFAVIQSADPDGDAAAFHAMPFEPHGPRVAVLLLHCASHDELCVRFDHVAGDGWSTKEVTHLLAETYTRLLGDADYAPLPRTAPRPSHADVWAALSEEQRAAASEPEAFATSKWRTRDHVGDGPAFRIRGLTLSPERVACVRGYAHRRGATLNEALIASLVRSAASIFPPAPGAQAGVSVSADPRRFAAGHGLDRIAMIATTQTVLVDFEQGESFDETLRHVVEGVEPHRRKLWGIGATQKSPPPPVLMRVLFGSMTATMRAFHALALVTMNWGSYAEERLLFGEARPTSVVALGPIPKFGGFPATISAYRDAVTISMGVRDKYMRLEAIERCLDGIDEQLSDAVQSVA